MQTPMLPGRGAGVALGHVRGALDVAGEDVVDAAALLHRRVEGVDRGAGHAEGVRHTFLLQDRDGGVGRCHACHVDFLHVWSPVRLGHLQRASQIALTRRRGPGSARRHPVCEAAGAAAWPSTAAVPYHRLPSGPGWCAPRAVVFSRPGPTAPAPASAGRSGRGRRRRSATSAAMSCATRAPSGTTTPASRAAAVTMPMSLWCKVDAGSRAGSCAPACSRPCWSSTVLPASPPPSTSQRRAGVHAVRLEEHDRLGHELDVACHDELVGGLDGLAGAAQGRRGRSSCRARREPAWPPRSPRPSPPTMIDRLASTAPFSPPETGASSSA